MKNTKNRTVFLDPYKVQARAAELGIKNLREFEREYCNFFHRSGSHSSPRKTWTGVGLYQKNAQDIADLLELISYHELEYDTIVDRWQELLDASVTESFSEILLESQQVKGMFSLENYIVTDDIPRINSFDRFKLRLKGNPNESFAIFFFSTSKIYQLAPIDHENFINVFKEAEADYPNSFIPFEENSVGWHACIVLKSPNRSLPISNKPVNSPVITRDELNIFARKLENKTLMINKHEFILLNS